MKKYWSLFLFPMLVLGLFILSSSKNERIEKKRYFMVTYTTGPSWVQDKEPTQQAYFKEHSNFINGLEKSKISLLGGRYAEKGMVIISAKDEAEAQRIFKDDSSLVYGTFKAQIDELYLFQKGCVE